MLHFRYPDQESLAHRVYLEQLAMGWPGLASEVEQICKQLNIENVNTTKQNKYNYKKIFSTACHLKNEQILRNLSEGKDKCVRMANGAYGQKDYIVNKYISDVRNMYRTRYGHRDFAGYFSHNNKYRESNWMCKCGLSREKRNSHNLRTMSNIFRYQREIQ